MSSFYGLVGSSTPFGTPSLGLCYESMSAETGTTLNPFRSLPYIGMYGKVSMSFFLFFLFYIDHVVVTICQFVEIQLHRGG
jgi:hypothetical protein